MDMGNLATVYLKRHQTYLYSFYLSYIYKAMTKKVWFLMLCMSSLMILQGCSGSTPAADSWSDSWISITQRGLTADEAEKFAELENEAQGWELKAEVKELEEVGEQVDEGSDTDEALTSGTTKVAIETSFWTMEAVLYDSTPLHRDNFIKLANEWFYDDLLFHRVIEGFMIQGWDPESRGAESGKRLGTGWPGYQIPAEIGAPHIKGALAAARNNNPEKKSSGSQFYIVQGKIESEASLINWAKAKGITYSAEDIAAYTSVWGTSMLDAEYTVFGEVIVWVDVIDKIAATETAPGDRPVSDVKMKVKVIE